MSTFYFIRHGKTDFSQENYAIYQGRGHNMLTLCEEGIRQIEAAAKDQRLQGAEIIVTSPFGRTLHSSAILGRALDLDIRVETMLHEWQAKPDGTWLSDEEAMKAYTELNKYHGVHPKNKNCDWETAEDMKKRVFGVLDNYMEYEKVIVVCHGTLMQYCLDIPHPNNGEIFEYQK